MLSVRVRPVALLIAALLLLAGCSDAGSTSLAETGAPVTGNNENYAYAAGSVPQSQWPNPCKLLPRDSAATALGTTVHVKRFHNRCIYAPLSATFPTLNLAIVGVGNSQDYAFEATVNRNSRFKPHRLPDVGQAAAFYQLNRAPILRLDLLTDQGTFELTLTSPVATPIGKSHGRTILKQVAKVLDTEFSG